MTSQVKFTKQLWRLNQFPNAFMYIFFLQQTFTDLCRLVHIKREILEVCIDSGRKNLVRDLTGGKVIRKISYILIDKQLKVIICSLC